MTKIVYLVATAATAHRGNNDAKLNAAASWWTPLALSEARGADTTGTAVTATVVTVAGATPGVEVTRSSLPAEWISEPLSADFTISGSITANLWAAESSNSANSAINFALDKIDGATGALTRIATSVRVTELGTSAAAANFATTPTSTACKRGDRLRLRVFADDAGTMGTGFTVTFYFDRSTAAQGESWIRFTEDLTFETDPTTSVSQAVRDTSTNFGETAAKAAVAQTFVAQYSKLVSLTVALGKDFSPADNVVVEIQTDSGGLPTGTVAGAVATVSGASLGSVTPLTWSGLNIALTAGNTYHVVVRRSGAFDGAAFYETGMSAGAQTGWNRYLKYDSGTTVWSNGGSPGPLSITWGYEPPAYYLTDTAATINPGAATEKVASTTRGSGSVNAVTNTAAGPTAPIQITASGGGTAVEWYTPALEAVTLGGKAKINIRALESNAAANASLKAEIAVTAGDGTGATVWGVANIQSDTTLGGEVGTSDAAYIAGVAGDDVAVTAGQRLRFRIYVDDPAIGPLVTGNTVTVSYGGTTAAAAGDTYAILPVIVVEQAGAPAEPKRKRMQQLPSVAVARAAVR